MGVTNVLFLVAIIVIWELEYMMSESWQGRESTSLRFWKELGNVFVVYLEEALGW